LLVSEHCDLDYSVFKQTGDANDVGWICDGVKYRDLPPEPVYDPVSPTATSTRDYCDFVVNHMDWRCQSSGDKIGFFVVLAIVLTVICLFLIAVMTSGKQDTKKKKLAADLKDSESAASKTQLAELRKETIDNLHYEIAILEQYENLFDENKSTDFVAQDGEQVVCSVAGVILVETTKGQATFVGGSSGVSYRLTKRISVRSSSFRGTRVEGQEKPTEIDRGTFWITTSRAVFIGTKTNREFLFTKILGFRKETVNHLLTVLYITVNNRGKVSGIACDLKNLDESARRLALALAISRDSRESVLQQKKSELALLEKVEKL